MHAFGQSHNIKYCFNHQNKKWGFCCFIIWKRSFGIIWNDYNSSSNSHTSCTHKYSYIKNPPYHNPINTPSHTLSPSFAPPHPTITHYYPHPFHPIIYLYILPTPSQWLNIVFHSILYPFLLFPPRHSPLLVNFPPCNSSLTSSQ